MFAIVLLPEVYRIPNGVVAGPEQPHLTPPWAGPLWNRERDPVLHEDVLLGELGLANKLAVAVVKVDLDVGGDDLLAEDHGCLGGVHGGPVGAVLHNGQVRILLGVAKNVRENRRERDDALVSSI